ncbi:MAG: hypothetical protein Fur0010_01650 [Bdellovibrio sp.]
MAREPRIFNDRFWTVLKHLDQLEEEMTLPAFRYYVGLEDLKRAELFEVISFLKNFEYGFEIKMQEEEVIIVPPKEKREIMISLSLSEWMALQAHFPLLEEYSGKSIHQTLVEKLNQVELAYAEFDLFKFFEEENEKQNIIKRMHEQDAKMVEQIEDCLKSGLLLQVNFKDKKQSTFFPHRLVFLEGELSVVGEDTTDRSLVSISVNEIEDVRLLINSDYVQNFTPKSIDDFIQAIRSVAGSEERMVLKIKNPENVDLKPPYHFLGNPYMTSNMNGDLIWAASVEMTDDLMEWLFGIKDSIEILDPEHLRERFEEYQLQRLAKHKKAA